MRLTCRKPSRMIIAFTAFLVMLSMLTGFNAFAASADYIATWDEYKNAGNPSASWNDVANAMDSVFEAADALYQNGDADGAFKAVNAGYYGYYETTGFERVAMGYIAGSRKTEVELQFSSAKAVTKNGGSTDEFWDELNTLSQMIHEDANKLDGLGSTGESGLSRDGDTSNSDTAASDTDNSENADNAENSGSAENVDSADNSGVTPSANAVSVGGGGGGWVTFMACFGIILREGLEAILVVGAIIAYLVKSGNKDKLRYVYIGCVFAIGASFLCAWLLDLLKLANSANQEVIEGITALIAVVVLFYVSNWMVSKAESEAWTNYIDSQVRVSAETGSVFTLGFTAFLAVFREGAEVILFFQPLLNDDKSMVWGGFGAGCAVLAVVFVLIRFFSVKLPIRPFFLGTGILMFVMSISFLGSGIKELIEGDVITMTSPTWLSNLIPTNNVMDVLGLYPCYQTLIPQLILILITVMIFVFQGRKEKNRKEAGVLAIVFGGLGIDKFYLGKYGQGLICAVFCWSFIPAFVGIANGIHYLTETDEKFEEELKPKAKKSKSEKSEKTGRSKEPPGAAK
ncbi:MAG: FTR1 family protein [Ruminococcus sp.]|nr:FTR1 family protein [Ruminococcus sp.]